MAVRSRRRGKLEPMVASDGPHYGANVRMDGPGKYHVAYGISPGAHGFLRHTDKETGVSVWWQPFTTEWDFIYTGTGKKGGY
jgi:periplasmic iron binding protein